MARGGRKPTPRALKVLRGNPGKRAIQEEPKPRPIAPRCPAALPKEAKRVWQQLSPELERLGLLTAVDGPAFAMTLTHLAIALQAVQVLKEAAGHPRGKRSALAITAADPDHPDGEGQAAVRKHPALQILRDNSAAFRQWCAEFGLTPAARAHLGKTQTQADKDAFEEFLADGESKAK